MVAGFSLLRGDIMTGKRIVELRIGILGESEDVEALLDDVRHLLEGGQYSDLPWAIGVHQGRYLDEYYEELREQAAIESRDDTRQ